jgi:hypothetical protein
MSDKKYTDTEMLDAIQDLTQGYGSGWLLRESSNGRGMRLHETAEKGGFDDIREAITNYLNQAQ